LIDINGLLSFIKFILPKPIYFAAKNLKHKIITHYISNRIIGVDLFLFGLVLS